MAGMLVQLLRNKLQEKDDHIATLEAANAALREEVEDAQRRINEFCDDAARRYRIRVEDMAETLDVALETIRDMRSYLRAEWDWKYGPEWDERERRINALLARVRGEEQGT